MLTCDWSSDVCSSDLYCEPQGVLSLRDAVARHMRAQGIDEIGRASCRERVLKWAGDGTLNERIQPEAAAGNRGQQMFIQQILANIRGGFQNFSAKGFP